MSTVRTSPAEGRSASRRQTSPARDLAPVSDAHQHAEEAPAIAIAPGRGDRRGPNLLTPGTVMALQRAVGNQAVLRLLVQPASSHRPSGPITLQRATTSIQPRAASAFGKTANGEDEFAKTANGEDEFAKTADGEDEFAKEASEVSIETDRVAPLAASGKGRLMDGRTRELFAKASCSVKKDATPSQGLGGDYGLTWPESVDVKITAKLDKTADEWSPKVTSLKGHYSQQASLLAGQSEITGPGGNTTQANHAEQAKNLAELGEDNGNPWYMLKPVKDHENVHAKGFKPGLVNARDDIVSDVESLTLSNTPKLKKKEAIRQIEASNEFQTMVTDAQSTWVSETAAVIANDHDPGGPTEQAERKTVDPMRAKICKHAKKKKWASCAHCPP